MEMPYSPPLLELPVHLVTMVLAQLDSMPTLGSAILSHSLFYDSFRGDTRHIVQRILRSQIPLELIHYAEAAFKSKFVDNEKGKEIHNVLRRAFVGFDYRYDSVPSQEWCLEWVFDRNMGGTEFPDDLGGRQDSESYSSMGSLSIANSISKTHTFVGYFCGCFVRERLPLMQKLVGRRLNSGEVQPSQMELFRIRRALYRFQIYCNLMFRNEVDFHPGRWVRVERNYLLDRYFFNPFPPWIDEQLCCIHDYLEETLSRSFDEVAAHDIVWGAMSVDWLAQGRKNEYKQAFLTYGLPFLFDLDTRKDYHQRRRLLESKGLPRTPVALAAHLERPVPNYSHALGESISLFPIPTRVFMSDEWTSNRDDLDGLYAAPPQLWLKAHKGLRVREMCYWPENLYLRKCGYVMWDIDITSPGPENPDFDEEMCQWIKNGQKQALMEAIERQRGRDQMRRSWEQRAAIYHRGGRGYWGPDGLDEISSFSASEY